MKHSPVVKAVLRECERFELETVTVLMHSDMIRLYGQELVAIGLRAMESTLNTRNEFTISGVPSEYVVRTFPLP